MLLQRSTEDDRTANELARGVLRIHEFAPVINAYIVDDVRIDSGRRWDRKRIFKALECVRRRGSRHSGRTRWEGPPLARAT